MNLDIPGAWHKLDLSGLAGTLMVIGAPDVGKTTFARYLFGRLAAEGQRVAFLDGDPGQTHLGPPTTMTVSPLSAVETGYTPKGESRRWFVGSTTPSGHMLQVLSGAGRLVQAAAASTLVYDTSGLVDPTLGGVALKFAKIDLLRPATVFAIQKNEELEPILQPLRRSRRTQLVVLEPSPGVQRRDAANRQAHRASQFSLHFTGSRVQAVDWGRYGVFPYPQFALNRLVALEDPGGFTLALGIIQSIDRQKRRIEIITPLDSLEQVTALHLGDLLVEPGTFRDRRI